MMRLIKIILTLLLISWMYPFSVLAQTDNDEVRIQSLLSDPVKIRAFCRLHSVLTDIDAARSGKSLKDGKKDESERWIQQADGHLTIARNAYEAALKKYPENAMLHNFYGELLYDRFDERDNGVAEWEKAAELDRKFALAWNNLGIHYCHSGDYQKGLHDLDEALKLDPNNPDFLFNLAQIYLTSWPQVMPLRFWSLEQLYGKAMEASKKSAELAPGDYDLVSDYARNFFIAPRLNAKIDSATAAKAWQAARKVARNNAESFNAVLNEGRIWLMAKDNSKAAACFEEALKMWPKSKLAKQLLDEAKTKPKKKSKSATKGAR